jgi:c-di-GMP-binding flagellar brake protein YcgR
VSEVVSASSRIGKGWGEMNRIFLPMDAEGQPVQEEATSQQGIERRRYTRHRYVNRVEIYLQRPGARYNVYEATTFEISEGGMSAATPNILFIGERVEVGPVIGERVKAIVRRKQGAMYGFEFIGLSDGQREEIRKTCEKLPLFQSLLNV